MATATTKPTVPLLTYADLDFVPKEREGDRHELFDGVLVVTPSPIPAHQLISLNTVRAIDAAVLPNHLGRVYPAPIDVVFAPKLVAVPDVVYVRRERLRIVGPRSIQGAPDLIVEILSPSTKRRDLRAKRALYERFGVREYWTLDPTTRSATVDVQTGERYAPLLLADGVIRSTVIPGLEVVVASLFVDV